MLKISKMELLIPIYGKEIKLCDFMGGGVGGAFQVT